MAIYRLPNGKETDDQDFYLQQWESVGEALSKIVVEKLIGFDPSYLFQYGCSSFSIPGDIALRIVNHHDSLSDREINEIRNLVGQHDAVSGVKSLITAFDNASAHCVLLTEERDAALKQIEIYRNSLHCHCIAPTTVEHEDGSKLCVKCFRSVRKDVL